MGTFDGPVLEMRKMRPRKVVTGPRSLLVRGMIEMEPRPVGC